MPEFNRKRQRFLQLARGHQWWDGGQVRPERLQKVGLSLESLQVQQLTPTT